MEVSTLEAGETQDGGGGADDDADSAAAPGVYGVLAESSQGRAARTSVAVRVAMEMILVVQAGTQRYMAPEL